MKEWINFFVVILNHHINSLAGIKPLDYGYMTNKPINGILKSYGSELPF